MSRGSAELAGSQGEQQQILVSLDVATYNVRKATCGTVCWECDGAVDSSVFLSPFAVAVSGTAKETFYLTYNTGGQYDYSPSATWSSSSTSTATVNGTGVVSGVRVGSFNLYASIYDFTEGIGWYCTDMYFYCPTSNFSGGSQGSSAQPPTVTFSNINYLVVGQTATINATVSPSNNAIPISLSISSQAAVLTPAPPGTFTRSTPVQIKGLNVGIATLTATISNADGALVTVGSTSFPVTSAAPTATVTQRTSGTVSSDNAALSAYDAVEGSTNLGPILTSQGCFGGFEAVGSIAPNNYPGNVILRRQVTSDAAYTNSTNTGGTATAQDDTSDPRLRDDNPQSGGSNGKVYDLDAPGTGTTGAAGSNIYRYRGNFFEYATLPDGTKISSNYSYYVRVSCKKISASQYQLVTDVPGDNQIGPGTTPITWNLQ